ncbi:hypothetical protein BH10CHL1_BH10CHL1_30070 [soil metagenome]
MIQWISQIKCNFAVSFAVSFAVLSLLGCGGATSPTSVPPSWTKSKVLATNEDHPSKILVDDAFVYYVTGGTVASQQEGTNNIKRIALKNGEVSVLVKGGEQIPDTVLALDEQFVYWSNGSDILRVPKMGGPSEVIVAGAPMPAEMLVDDDNIYWLIWGGENAPPQPVMFAPKQGGKAKPLTAPESAPNGLSLDSKAVYWMASTGIRTVAKSGGEATSVYANPTPKQVMSGLIQDTENFYFAQMTAQGSIALMRLAKNTKTLTQLAPSINWTFDFVADDAYVYYFTEDKGGGSFGPIILQKVAKQGGEPITLDKGSAGWVKYVAFDQAQLYFTDIAQVYALHK